MSSPRRRSNVHSDYALDQLETEEDCRGLLALLDTQASMRLGKITALPSSYSDAKQRERRPDKAIKAEVFDADGKVIGARIYLFEFKSSLSKTELLLQLLAYITILWVRYGLPVTPVIVYTGKRRLRQNGCVNFRQHMQRKNPVMNEHDLDFSGFLLNLFGISVAVLLAEALPIAPGLYLAPRIFDLSDEVVAEFFRLCAQLPWEQREKKLEKGCIFIIKYAPEFGWDRLVRIEQETLPEEEWLVARLKFSREDYGREQLQHGLAEGRVEGRVEGKDEARHEIAMRMLEEGEPEAKISHMTGMTKKELALLKRGLKARK